jgi:hypothetical protein
LAPVVLLRAVLRVVLSTVFRRVLDPRDLLAEAPPPLDTTAARAREAWIDYVADTGDGFDATCTIASLLASPSLRVDGLEEALPRGQLLVLGGDEVYPTPGARAYRDRFVGPYSAVDPRAADDGPRLFAIPGNHDWFDGLGTFLPVFADGKAIGGWQTMQRRSYFAIRLPHGWWLWGVDLPEFFPIDGAQDRFFRRVTEEMEAGSRVIVVTSAPTWVKGEADRGNGGNLAYLDRELLQPKGIEAVVMIAGDSHHYMRYSSSDGAHRITAGGGGAFLHPTHGEPQAVVDSQRRQLTRAAAYPAPSRSRALAWCAALLPFRNLRFVLLAGAVAALLLWSNYAADRQELLDTARQSPVSAEASSTGIELGGLGPVTAPAPEEVLKDWSWGEYLSLTLGSPSFLVIVVLLALLVGMADPPQRSTSRWRRGLARAAMGSVLLVALLAVVGLGTIGAIGAVPSDLGAVWFAIAVTAAVVVVAGSGVAFVLGTYFAACSALPSVESHGNEAFAASRLTGYKNFLRLHIDTDGVLTIYAIGVRRVCRRWRADSDGSTDVPRLVPRAEPCPRLIDRVTVPSGRSGGRPCAW